MRQGMSTTKKRMPLYLLLKVHSKTALFAAITCALTLIAAATENLSNRNHQYRVTHLVALAYLHLVTQSQAL